MAADLRGEHDPLPAQEGFGPDRDLILALTADEEGGGHNGVDWLLEEPPRARRRRAGAQRGRRRLAEGRPAASPTRVQASEKVVPELPAGGDEPRRPQLAARQGQRDLPPGRRARRVWRLSIFPSRLNEVTRAFFERAAATVGRSRAAADMPRRRAQRSPTRPPRRGRALGTALLYNARLRTTCVATLLEGGHADNALPQTARAVVNCRMLPDETPSRTCAGARRGSLAERRRSPSRRSARVSRVRRRRSRPSSWRRSSG